MGAEKKENSSIFEENRVVITVSPLTRILLRFIRILPGDNKRSTVGSKVLYIIFFTSLNVPLTIGGFGFVYKGFLGEI